MAALVLTVLTFGPSLDSYICRDEGGLSAAAAEATVLAVQGDHAPDDHGGPAGECVHGHCHHGAAFVPMVAIATEAPRVSAAKHELVRVRVPTAEPRFGFMRPPRA